MHAPRKICGKLTLFLDGLFGFGGGKLGGELLVLLQELLLGHELWLSSFVAESVAARGFLEALQQGLETLARATTRAVRVDEILDVFNQFVKFFEAQVSRVATGVFHMNEFSLGSGALDELGDDWQA